MDWRLETLVVPVADVDRAKAFYADAVGFHVDVDHTRRRGLPGRPADTQRVRAAPSRS